MPPRFDQQFGVTAAASDIAVWDILESDFGQGLQPTAFACRKLNNAETCYSAYDRGLLGIIWGLAQWPYYFVSHHAEIVIPDHSPLRCLPRQNSVNTRLWKFSRLVEGWKLGIQHVAGKVSLSGHLSRQSLTNAMQYKTKLMEKKEFIERIRFTER